MKRYYTLLLFFTLSIFSCSQWKVSELKSRKIFTIPKGDKPGSLSIKFPQNRLLDLSFALSISNEKILCADNRNKNLQVFDMDGNLSLIIGKQFSNIGKKTYKYSSFSFGNIGNVISGANEKIYLQNRLVSHDNNSKKSKGGELDISPSYVLVFDKDGNLEYTLGQKGKTDIPFYYIENMVSDLNNRLFVISKNYDNWSVYRFTEKNRDLYINFPKDMFKEKENEDNDEEYAGVIENIDIFNSGEKLLLSVAFYNNTRFKYRKIIEYNLNEQSIGKTLLEIPDPKNELFKLLNDKYILLWNVDGDDIRFTIWNFQGSIINNLKIIMDQKKSFYGDILMDRQGKFYTYSVYKNGVEIQEWN